MRGRTAAPRAKRSRRLLVGAGAGRRRTYADFFLEPRVALDLPGGLFRVFAENVDGVVGAIELAEGAADALLFEQHRDLPDGPLVVGTGAGSLAHDESIEGASPDAPFAADARLQIDEGDRARVGLEHVAEVAFVVVNGFVGANDAAGTTIDAKLGVDD